MWNTKDRVAAPMYAVVPYFNPLRYKSREKHTLRALKHFHECGFVIVLVEVAFNHRALTFADSGLEGSLAACGVVDREYRHRYVPLRTRDELWLKENAINVAVGRALEWEWGRDGGGVAWLDADVHFIRPNIAGATVHALEHYAWVQMFSHARDVGPDYEVLPESWPHADGLSWVNAHERQLLGTMDVRGAAARAAALGGHYYARLAEGVRVWPGLAWACTREAWDQAGGLFDLAVWGGGDWHMAHALVDKRDTMMRADLSPAYRAAVHAWADRVQLDFRRHRRNVGMVEGSIFHYFHGPKSRRGYNEKHGLLARAGFDPTRHLKRDFQGLWQLHDDGTDSYLMLRDDFRRIARERSEDGGVND